jgi:hypothetical protein
MTKILAVVGGIGAGAALMFLLDPDRGRRRRALIRDKAVGLSHDFQRAVHKKSTHLSNRAQGLLHEAKVVGGGRTRRNGNSGRTAA